MGKRLKQAFHRRENAHAQLMSKQENANQGTITAFSNLNMNYWKGRKSIESVIYFG